LIFRFAEVCFALTWRAYMPKVNRSMSILDRYILKKFSVPFLYCFGGFIGIWFIFDLADNLQDFIQGSATFEMLVSYYASQVPEIIIIALPLGTLLALLYSLSAMSRSNEIISMLGSGRSVVRILVPLMVVGVVLTGVTAFFNYEGTFFATGKTSGLGLCLGCH
jgi:lipopolysaccharide export system permease protein